MAAKKPPLRLKRDFMFHMLDAAWKKTLDRLVREGHTREAHADEASRQIFAAGVSAGINLAAAVLRGEKV